MDAIYAKDLVVLLIEPSAMQSGLIENRLYEQDISHVDTATTKSEALEKILKYPPDLVLSNMYYEDGTACELLEEIHRHEQFQHLPFVLISSEHRDHHLETVKQSGVQAILSKPFNPDELHDAVQATLSFLNKTELQLTHLDPHTLRVIVVDDSRLARKAITKVLRNLGLKEIIEFEDGSHAINYLAENEVDLVVTDYNMPEVNGIELTKHIRQSTNHADVPILMVTSQAADSQLRFVKEAGVNAVSDKPFNTNTVKKLLMQILNH